MTLRELKQELAASNAPALRLFLSGGEEVDPSFHVTEVAKMQRTFYDCGGVLRDRVTCQLQVWIGDDVEHRLSVTKFAGILRKAARFFVDDEVDVEIEMQRGELSLLSLERVVDSAAAFELHLTSKQAACLAPERCGLMDGRESSSLRRGVDFQPLARVTEKP